MGVFMRTCTMGLLTLHADGVGYIIVCEQWEYYEDTYYKSINKGVYRE